MAQGTTLADTEILTRELDELDRVLHRVRTRLQGLPKKKSQLEHWREMKGILKGKITEDPLTYQRRIRAESERYPV